MKDENNKQGEGTNADPGPDEQPLDEGFSRGIDPTLGERPVLEVVRERINHTSVGEYATLWSLLMALSVPFWIYVMMMATSGVARALFGIGFLGGVLLLYVLLELIELVDGGTDYIVTDLKRLFSREHVLETASLLVSAVITVVTTGYLYTNFHDLIDRGYASTPELTMAVAFTFVIMYLTWRAFGLTFLAIVVLGILYALFGNFVPGVLGHGGMSVNRVLRNLVITVDGFFGFLTQLTAAWIALFLLFAGMLKAYGAFDLILRGAVRSAKYLSSGVAQTAVVASAVIGSVNGSQTANAGMTGSFTIPMMKENSVKPSTAGGIESVASTSGQVLPPVMGAGAFVMASFLGIRYVDVLVAGLIPAAILMISIFVGVHYAAAPQIDDPEMEGYFSTTLSTLEVTVETLKFGIPMLVLIYFLGIAQYTVQTSAFYTVVSMAALGIALPTAKTGIETGNHRLVFWRFVDTVKQTLNGFREGVLVLAPVAIILAAINGVVDLFEATGVPGAIALALMDLSGGVLLLAAIMAMIICILLGLGMPTTAAYTVVALLVAPSLINQFFVPDMAAHFFVFYAAILAGLTPPIATCVAVATGIAGSNFWRTCLEAVKISAPLFVLPFAFIYRPELVDHGGSFSGDLLAISFLIMLGAITIIHGLNYRFDLGRWSAYGLRTVFLALGIAVMVYPELLIQLGALAVAALLYLTQAAVGQETPLERLKGIASGMNGRGK